MLNGLDLFSGIGGLTLALTGYASPLAYCENDRYAQAVLLQRMREGSIPYAPICDDIKNLQGTMLPPIDIIYGGFPCQDVSAAGLRKGLDGERTGLFREAIRLVRECRPKFLFFENVPGIRRYVPEIRSELEATGYDCRDGFLSAAEVGANHIRQRWWLLAYSKNDGIRRRQQFKEGSSSPRQVANSDSDTLREQSRRFGRPSGKDTTKSTDNVCNSQGIGIKVRPVPETEQRRQAWTVLDSADWWSTEPDVDRVAHGIPCRMDRIKGLGNAVVPLQARKAFEILIGIKS